MSPLPTLDDLKKRAKIPQKIEKREVKQKVVKQQKEDQNVRELDEQHPIKESNLIKKQKIEKEEINKFRKYLINFLENKENDKKMAQKKRKTATRMMDAEKIYDKIKSDDKYDTPHEEPILDTEKLIEKAVRKELDKKLKDNPQLLQRLIGMNNKGFNSPIGGINSVDPLMSILNAQPPNNQQNNNDPNKPLLDFLTKAFLLQMQQNKSNNNGDNSASMMNMFGELMKSVVANTDQKFQYLLERNAPSPTSPEDRMMRTAEFIRELQGDNRAKTKDEMDFSIKRQELLLGEQQRIDMLDREERAEAREMAKSDRTLSLVNTVADKIIGNGLGQLVGDLVSARGKGGKKSNPEPEIFDASLLDEFPD